MTNDQARTRAITLWALAGITALGAFVRFWQIASLPPGYWYDEAHKSIVALEIVRGLRAPIYVAENQGIEAGYFWLLAGWFRLFGPSYSGSRLLSALLGSLTVPLTFWAARTLYRAHPRADAIGLVSAGGLGVMLWPVHWSRLGLETITVPIFSVALLGLLAWAWQAQRAWAFVIAGAALGLSQYTNPGARVLPLQALFVFVFLAERTPKKAVGFGAAFLAGALGVYAPLGWFFLNNPEWFFNRIAFTSSAARAAGPAFYFDNLIKVLLAFNVRGDVMPRHNLSLRPALDAAASLWMWAGAWIMARDRIHRREHGALFAAFAVNLIPMILSDGAPGFGRMLGAAPLLMMFPALGVVAGWQWITHRAWRLLAAASLLLSAGLNMRDYFVLYPHQPALFDSFEVGLWTLARSAERASESGTGYLILDEAAMQHPATRLTRELAAGDLRIVNGQVCFAYPAQTTAATTFATLPQWAPLIEGRYPHAAATDVLHEPEVYRYGVIIDVPAGTAGEAASQAGAAKFGSILTLMSVDLPGGDFAPGAQAPVTLRWLALDAPRERYTTFVHLSGADRPLITGIDAEPCAGWYPTDQWQTGEVVEYTLSLTLPPDLAPGVYDLAVGVYQWQTGKRLPVSQPDQREPDRAFVATLTVK